MQRRTSSATSALLQKVNSQLKGERIKKPEDELDAYISSLTQKTSQQKKSVNFEDFGESISISSDIEDAPNKTKNQPASTSGSKFLKKKLSVSNEAESSPGAGASKFLKTAEKLGDAADLDAGGGGGGNKFLKKPQASVMSPSPAYGAPNRAGSAPVSGSRSTQGGQGTRQGPVSSALQKASALTDKIQQKAVTRKVVTMESDSDESFNLQMAKSVGDLPSDSLTSESVKVGRDGGKFLKKTAPVKSTPTAASEPQQSSSTQKKEKTPAQPDKIASQQKKASPFTLKSSLKYSTEVVLNSEEESLAEYMEGLQSSSGDSFEKFRRQGGRQGKRHTPSPPHSRQGKRSPSPPPPARQSGRPTPVGQHRSPSPTTKPPAARRTPSPSPRTSNHSPSPHLRKRSASPKMMRSFSDDSNVADSIKSEIADDYDLGVNIIMDLDDLAPADESVPPKAQDDSPFRPSVRKSEKENKQPKKSALKSSSDISVKDYPKLETKSPFRASENTDKSPFKSKKDQRDSSPFKSKQTVEDSPFKPKVSDDSPFKSKSKSGKSPFAAKFESSPFKAKESSSSFKAKRESSPSKAKMESVFKSSAQSSSPFKAADKNRSETSSPFRSKKDKSGRRSPFKSKEKGSKKNKQKSSSPTRKKSKKDKDIFSSLGIQTVEDLLGDSTNIGGDSIKVSEFDSIVSDVEDRSEVSEEIKTEKPSLYTGSYKRDEDSASEIASEIGSVQQAGPSYTEDFESISEQIGATSVKDRRYPSVSEVKTRYSGDDTAVDDYTEFSESDTEPVASYSRSSYRSDRSYTSYADDYSRSLVRTSTDLTPLPRSGMKTAEAQTIFDSAGLHYHWDPFASGLAFPGVPVGLGFVDPTPIATHVVSADALETMTAYSPAMLALHDMLKAQLELTREFLQNQERLHKEYTSDIQPNYHYTTLEDTKQYIKKHRKKRLTFKEALKLVDKEMGRR